MVAAVRILVALVALVGALVGTLACAMQAVSEPGEGLVAGKKIEAVLKQHTDRLMSVNGVVGTAIGECEGKPCIRVLVVKKTPALLSKIPSSLEGFPVVIDETGEIRRLDTR